jgi:hypothetical protein
LSDDSALELRERSARFLLLADFDPTRFYRQSMRRPELALVFPLALAACSGGHFSDAPGAPTTVTAACQDVAQSRCNRRVNCTSSVDSVGASLVRVYGDLDTCLTREALQCRNQATAAGAGATPAGLERCAAAVDTMACADFFDNVPPPACLPGGARAAAEPCAFNGQCSSGYCGGTRQNICGRCDTAPGAGGDCTDSNCGRDLICVASTNLCQSRSGAGASCSSAQPCRSDLNCISTSGAAATADSAGTCQAAATTVGSSCGTGTTNCDALLGLYCGGTKSARTCAALNYAPAGMPCGLLPDGSRVTCIAGDCYTDTGLASSTDLGTCKAFASDGTACDTELGPTCLNPARCVTTNGSAGVCTVALGGSCG